MTKIELENGKYTVTHNNGVGLRATRYGVPWRDLVGEGLVLAMAHRIEELAAEVNMCICAKPVAAQQAPQASDALEAEFHKAIKTRLSKPDQGKIMGVWRAVMAQQAPQASDAAKVESE